MKTLPVTVLSGFPGAGKTTVLNHILNHRGGMSIAVIMNSMRENVADAQQLLDTAAFSRTDERHIELSSGCICCTLRGDLLVEVSGLARDGRYDYLLIESTGISEPLPVAETFAFVDENGESLSNSASLDTMVTVVDASSFMDDYLSTEELRDRGIGIDEDDNRDIARLLVDQIEFANVILLNKTDLVSADEAGRLVALLKNLNPDAHVIPILHGNVPLAEIINTGRFQPHWADASALDPQSSESGDDAYGISTFTYRARRPFHPQRFWDFWMEGEYAPDILRSRGYFWLATRNSIAGFWSQVGQVLAAEPGGAWWAETPHEEWPQDDAELLVELKGIWDELWGDRRQELVIICQDLAPSELTAALDDCLLTDEEMQSGPVSWTGLADPFSPWVMDADHDPVHHHDHDNSESFE